MRELEEAAKPHVTALMRGEQLFLDQEQQQALASFIAQSALMIDLLGKAKNKFRKSDFKCLADTKKPPSHWYIGIGFYRGSYGVSADYSPQAAIWGSTRIVAHSVTTILGHLFTSVQTIDPPDNTTSQLPIPVNGPYLVPIWPIQSTTLRFPPRSDWTITGGLFHGGGLARDLSLRFPNAVMESIKQAYGVAS